MKDFKQPVCGQTQSNQLSVTYPPQISVYCGNLSKNKQKNIGREVGLGPASSAS